jgi:threonine/homoserine/homoserine lactone efflux protein
MLPLETVLLFCSASLLLALAPGPDNIFVLTQSALRGAFSGFIVTLGLCTGLIFHTTAVAFGVAAIFQTSDIAFTVLKVIGAAYLLYLAYLSWKAPIEVIDDAKRDIRSSAALFRRGVIMNITNPKVSIFFLAFLPQFADPSRGSMIAQIYSLGGLFMLSALVVFSMISLLSGRIGKVLREKANTQRLLNRIASGVFAGLALKLLTAQR